MSKSSVRRTRVLSLMLALGAAASSFADTGAMQTASGQDIPVAAPRADAEHPHNMCFGGLEDSKQIVHESQLTNPYRETTHLGCQIDGGRPAVMPDLPSPTAVQTLMG